MRRIIDESLDNVRHILETRDKALVALAELLIDKEVMDGGELKETVEANSPTPTIVPGTTDTAKRPTPGKLESPSAEPPASEAGEGRG